ncbi:hypothetical protein AGMMS50239_12590 [Bacteroidia bacterium]|nr:hypothetical protein AGMMS50239_12590 [Bacteroidia bacterium]
MKNLFILLFIFFFVSCSQRYSPEIEAVLNQAGNNRSELEKVLKHYSKNPADSLKLKAAEFLIVNMPGKYSEYYDAPWNDIAAVYWTKSFNKQKTLNAYQLSKKIIREDVKYITADYLINNIELSFKVWQETPWGKHIPFDTFCEEILPYRVSTEPLENWREKALASFADPYRDFLKDASMTSVNACIKINSLLPRFNLIEDFPAMTYSQLMASAKGYYDNRTALAIFSMRALGIPVTFDITLRWSETPISATGHSWNSVRDSAGNHLSFMGAESNPIQDHLGNTLLKNKVYRRMFAKQGHIHTEIQHIPPELRDNIMDISIEYTDMTDIEIPVKYQSKIQSGYAYLASQHNLEWHPVASGETDGKTIRYRAVGKNNLYLPVHYINDVQTPAGDPFWLDNNGKIYYYSSGSQDSLFTLTGISRNTNSYKMAILNGVIEGSQTQDFTDSVVLHTFINLLVRSGQSITIPVHDDYQSIRWKSSLTGYCTAASISFYKTDDNNLSESSMKTSVSTSLRDSWSSTIFSQPKYISKIKYTVFDNFSKNSDNPNLEYELYCYAKGGWTSLGKQTEKNDTLIYTAPSKALFYLRNVTLDKSGYMFCIRDGKPKFL